MSTAITEEEIEAGRSDAGGFTRATMRQWGVPWPPPKGWRETILSYGIPYDQDLNPNNIRGSRPDADLILRKVVTAVVEAGHASDLYGFPDVLAYFGAKIPEESE